MSDVQPGADWQLLLSLLSRDQVFLAVAYDDSYARVTMLVRQGDELFRVAAWEVDGPGGETFVVPFKDITTPLQRVPEATVREFEAARRFTEQVNRRHGAHRR